MKPGLLLAAVLAVGCSSTPVGVDETAGSDPSEMLAKRGGKKLGVRQPKPPDSQICADSPVGVESTSVECSVRRSDPYVLPFGVTDAR